jgi:cytidylate kinase
MYRVIGWACLDQDVDLHSEEDVTSLAQRVVIHFSYDRVFADDRDVTHEIRTVEVTQAASLVALNPGVRHEMVRQQRQVAEGLNIVTEGRDQGTVVFFDAECKFFLTADPRERARRRQREFQARNEEISFDELLQQIVDRDRRDECRTVSPLKPADDAIRIDTSALIQEEVLEKLEQIANEQISRRQS